jgi:hypothetical protein
VVHSLARGGCCCAQQLFTWSSRERRSESARPPFSRGSRCTEWLRLELWLRLDWWLRRLLLLRDDLWLRRLLLLRRLPTVLTD